MPGDFKGWRGDFQGCFLGLRMNNSKVYFDANRRRYEDEVKAPMVALLADLEPEFGPAHLSRPNRDILVAAGGRYMMDAAQLARFRAGIAAERSGQDLAKIVAALRGKGYDVEGQELKRVPPPHPQDHPRGELLRHKRLIYWKRWPIEPWIATAAARERIAKVWRDGADLNAWLARHIDAATE